MNTEARATLRIGVFTLVALGLLALGTLVVGKKSGLFVATYHLYAGFDDVGGLKIGQPVWLNGLDVGLVDEIELDPDRPGHIVVRLAIERRYQRWIRADSKAALATIGLLGDKIVNISIGSPDAPVLRNGDRIETVESVEIGEMVERVAGIVASFDELVAEINKLTTALAQGQGSLGRLLTDESLYERLRASVDQLHDFIAHINAGKGTLGALARREDLYERLSATVDQLARLTAEVEAGKGSLGRFLKGEEVHDETVQVLGELRTLSGELNLLVRDLREHPERYFRVSIF